MAHNYHRLLAVKDEWEVSRLYSHPDFKASLEREFEGDYKLHFHVGAWPFAKINPINNQVSKAEVGPWLMVAFRWMARLRWLRGSVVDPFRHNAERALERSLLKQYEADLDTVLERLDARTLSVAARLAALPQSIRGYGHVKEAQAATASASRDRLLAELSLARESQMRAA